MSDDIPVMRRSKRVSVTVVPGRHRVGGETWLSDRRMFVEMARQRPDLISESEIKAATKEMFPNGSR